MSYVTTAPVLIAEAAGQLRGIGLTVSAANATAAFPTTGVMPAAADEVSAMAAARFAAYGQAYQAIGAHAGMIHERFVSALDTSANSYASTEAANMRSVGLSNVLPAAASAQRARPAGRGGHGAGSYGGGGYRGGSTGVHRGGYAPHGPNASRGLATGARELHERGIPAGEAIREEHAREEHAREAAGLHSAPQQLAAAPASPAPAAATGQAVTQETVHGVPAGGVPIHQVSAASAPSAVPAHQVAPVNLTQAAPAHEAPAAAHPAAPAHEAPAPAAHRPAPATTHEAPAPAAHRPAPAPAAR